MNKYHILLLLLYPIIGFSQSDFDLQNTVRIPNTPEAEAFMTYGGYNVNLYSGTPDISIPIHTFQGRETNVSIGLTYDASGIKVGQLATSAGLGWNLKAGGRISRIINGGPDDYLSVSPAGSYYSILSDDNPFSTNPPLHQLLQDYRDHQNINSFSSQASASNFIHLLIKIDQGFVDAQPDLFTLNVDGINVFMYIDPSSTGKQPVVLDNPRIKVTCTYTENSISGWTVKNEDGTVYHFEERERIKSVGNDTGASPFIKDYYSSWLLTRIVSPNELDTYDFSYDYWGMSEDGIIFSQAKSETNLIDPEDTNPTVPINSGSINFFQPTVEMDRQHVSSITWNGTQIIDVSFKSRSDQPAISNAIDEITIYDPSASGYLSKVEFKHSYFGSSGTGRLKLDGINILDENGVDYGKNYSFDYFSPTLVPATTDLGQDHLGYYNGESNTTLVPEYTYTTGGFTQTFEGANRSVNDVTLKYGSLSSITYPTGGFTEFEYELPVDVENSSNTFEQDVTLYSLTTVGGSGDGSECGGSCQDRWGNNPYPAMESLVFYIDETKDYNISVVRGFEGVVYLHQLTNSTPVPYENTSSLTEIGYWHNNTNPLETTVSLAVGYYQAYIVNPQAGFSSSINIGETITVISETTTETHLAAQRIKSIKNFDAGNVFVGGKEYVYDGMEILDYKSLFNVTSKERYLATNEGAEAMEYYVTRNTSAQSNGHVPHVAYSYVKEIARGVLSDFGETHTDNGYTQHTFSVGLSGWRSLDGGGSYYSLDANIGKEVETNVYRYLGDGSEENNLVELVKKSTNQYSKTDYTGHNSGMFALYDGRYNNHFVRVSPKTHSDGSTYFAIERVRFVCLTANGTTCEVWGTPPSCSENGNICYGAPTERISGLFSRFTGITGSQEFLETTVNTTYYPGENSLVVENEITLTDDAYLLTRSKTVSNSESGKSKLVYYYPSDQSETVYNTMLLDNQVSKLVQSERYEVAPDETEILLETNRLNYTGNATTGIYPASRSTAISTNSLEVRETYSYSSGNIREAETFDLPGVKQTFIYSYDHRFLVAHIVNADFTSVKNKINSTTSITVDQLEAGNYDESTLINHLDGLYELEGAQVTLYTYIPGRGVSQIIDYNQRKTQYKYDDAGRLEKVIDDVGNILQKNEYNFGTSSGQGQ